MPQPRNSSSAPETPSLSQQVKSCDVCGNIYDKSFEVKMDDRTFTFDCFECAIHELAPECAHCHCRVIGHGTESNGVFFCCAHCARGHGAGSARDRVDEH